MMVQQRGFPVGGPEGVLDDWVQSFVEDERDEFRRRVVGAGLLAVVARGEIEAESPGGGVVAGSVGEEPFVDAAEFFAVEVAVVDRPRDAGFRVDDLCKRADCGEEAAVGQGSAGEHAQGVPCRRGWLRARAARVPVGRRRRGHR